MQKHRARLVARDVVANHAEISGFVVVIKMGAVVVETGFAHRYPHAVFQRFFVVNNRNVQHHADKVVGLLGIADDAKIIIALGLELGALRGGKLGIRVGHNKAQRG